MFKEKLSLAIMDPITINNSMTAKTFLIDIPIDKQSTTTLPSRQAINWIRFPDLFPVYQFCINCFPKDGMTIRCRIKVF